MHLMKYYSVVLFLEGCCIGFAKLVEFEQVGYKKIEVELVGMLVERTCYDLRLFDYYLIEEV